MAKTGKFKSVKSGKIKSSLTPAQFSPELIVDILGTLFKYIPGFM